MASALHEFGQLAYARRSNTREKLLIKRWSSLKNIRHDEATRKAFRNCPCVVGLELEERIFLTLALFLQTSLLAEMTHAG
jgi:hypothetical protein